MNTFFYLTFLVCLDGGLGDIDSENLTENTDTTGIRNVDSKKLDDLREAIMAIGPESLQNLLSSPNLTTTAPLSTPLPDINNELIDIVKDDTIGNFDQITIERDEDGGIVVTKRKRVFANGRKPPHNSHASMAVDAAESTDGPRLKNVVVKQVVNQTSESEDDAIDGVHEEVEDTNAFIQNEQLITICLAALGVTSTGLLMWIAIQHLYGIYTDFKKTINPLSYHDSNYSEEYECTSEMSARMADRPPTYDHSQEVHGREPHIRDPHIRDPHLQRHSIPAPPYMGPSTSQECRYDTGSLDLNTQQQMSYNSHHSNHNGVQYDDSDTSNWESDDEQFYQIPNSLNHPQYDASSYVTTQITSGPGRRTVSLPATEISEDQMQRRFALRRRMERFRRRRQSIPAIASDCQQLQTLPSNQVLQISNLRSLSQPADEVREICAQEALDEIDRLSTTSAPVENDFESAPELAELDIIHQILSRTNSRVLPRRTTSFVDRKMSHNGSIVSVMNIQIEIDVPSGTPCQVEEIND